MPPSTNAGLLGAEEAVPAFDAKLLAKCLAVRALIENDSSNDQLVAASLPTI
jgi:hypothetical protein